jgi:molybdopterin/thiamine biosynthesis adenylyltransferase
MSNIDRYSRQLLLPEFGMQGQKALESTRVLVIGAGGLGSPNIMYLAGAGVGEIGIVDGDVVDISNLHRQVIHRTEDIGRSKAESAADKAKSINPNVKVTVYHDWFNAAMAKDLIDSYDIIVDAVDSFQIKYLINDACVLLKKPFVHAGVVGWHGQLLSYIPQKSHKLPCLRCVVAEPSPKEVAPTCSRAGILGPMAGIVATIQSLEVIKTIMTMDKTSSFKSNSLSKLIMINGLTMNIRALEVKQQQTCFVCGDNPSITEVNDVEMPICDLEKK